MESLSEAEILYSPSKWSKRLNADDIIPEHIKVTTQESELVRKTIKHEVNIRYGPSDKQVYDIIGSDLPDDAPIFVYLHGGYWQLDCITKENSTFVAKILNKKNIKCVIAEYDLCPKVSVSEILQQIETMLKHVVDYAISKKSSGIYLSGHSAGVQLVAMLFANFIKGLSETEKSIIKSTFLISGVYNLLPLLPLTLNDPLKMNKLEAKAMSPILNKIHKNKGTIHYVIVGDEDSPAFVKQSEDYFSYLQENDVESELLILKGFDHFDIMEKLVTEDSPLTQIIVKAITDVKCSVKIQKQL